MVIGRFWRVTFSVFSHYPLFGTLPYLEIKTSAQLLLLNLPVGRSSSSLFALACVLLVLPLSKSLLVRMIRSFGPCTSQCVATGTANT